VLVTRVTGSFGPLRDLLGGAPRDLPALVAELLPRVPEAPPGAAGLGTTLSPVLETQFVVDGERIDRFTPLTTFGTAPDVLAAGIRVEHFFPADPRSAALCPAFFERATASGR